MADLSACNTGTSFFFRIWPVQGGAVFSGLFMPVKTRQTRVSSGRNAHFGHTCWTRSCNLHFGHTCWTRSCNLHFSHTCWTRSCNLHFGHTCWTRSCNLHFGHTCWTRSCNAHFGHTCWTRHVTHTSATPAGHGHVTYTSATPAGHGHEVTKLRQNGSTRGRVFATFKHRINRRKQCFVCLFVVVLFFNSTMMPLPFRSPQNLAADTAVCADEAMKAAC